MTGRGATAIYLALRAAEIEGGRVILPGNVCPAAVCPVLYSGNVPVFCDITLDDFTVDLDSLRGILASGASAVILPHAYGHVAPMRKIESLCTEAGALLIEDAAPSLGAEVDGKPAGGHGPCSVLSFGYAKIVDAGFGGALVADDRDLLKTAERLLRDLPVWTETIGRRTTDHAHLVRGWWNGRRTEERIDQILRAAWALYSDVYLWRLPADRERSIERALEGLPGIVRERRANAAAYDAALAHVPVTRPHPRPGSVCWRYTFLVDAGLRDAVVDTLRGKGVDASTLYPAAHRQFETPQPGVVPNCERLDREVINLWVAPPISPEDVRRNAAHLQQALEQAEASRQ